MPDQHWVLAIGSVSLHPIDSLKDDREAHALSASDTFDCAKIKTQNWNLD